MPNLVSETFKIKMTNIPLINLRGEFNVFLSLLSRGEFRNQFQGTIRPIETPYFVWGGMRGALLTILVQRAILGIEAYVPAAVFLEAGIRGVLNPKIAALLRNPFSLGRGTADCYYNRVPTLLSDTYALKAWSPELWESTRRFYREVRNPLLHGYEIDEQAGALGVLGVYEHIAALYDWVDSWHNPEHLIQGASRLSRVRNQKA